MYLWWIGESKTDERMIQEVRAHMEHVFGIPVEIWRGKERPADTFDPARKQHSSTQILRWLVAARPPEAEKVLALTDTDLFIPVLTFVFGEAQLEGIAAVVSTARLRTNPGGTVASRRLLSARLAKECVHELGHTFGLVHCADRRCVMARSASLLDVDAKGGGLCGECRLRFQDIRQRELEL
jgi:archaemetzincin